LSPIQFGTDGWRGVIGDTYTYDNVRVVAQATADHLMAIGAGGRVAVGYDCRFCSEDFALISAQQIAAAGFDVLLSNAACPSPATSYITKHRNASIGVMITASHNPPRYNGFKLKAPYGGSANADLTSPIEKLAQNMASAPVPKPEDYEGRIALTDFKKDYMAAAEGFVDLDTIKKVPGPILVDVMYGSGAGYLAPFLQGLGVDAREIRGERNTWFGGVNPEPLPQNLGASAKAVVAAKGKAVIVSDGDADRIAALDETGRFVNPHEIFSLMLMHWVEDKGMRGPVARSISSTTMIDALCLKYDLPLMECSVGFKWIADEFMKDPTMLIGGEESGGIGVRGHIPERDSQLNALLLLEMMAHRGKTLKQLVEEDLWGAVGFHCYDRRDLHLNADVIQRTREKVKTVDPAEIAGVKVKRINRRDGTRFEFEDGSWLLVRPSGTEPVVRVYSESTSCEKVQQFLDEGVALCR
jgi:phosphomannomutase